MRYILPGMGASSAMYSGPWRSLENTVFVDWPEMSGEITFATIASCLIDIHKINSEDQLVGTSLGGIVAQEICRQVNCNDITLISSATKREEINKFLIAISPLSEVTPIQFIQLLAGKSSPALNELFASVGPEFIRSACQELRHWEDSYEGEFNVKRLHGTHDHIIPCPNNVDLKLDGGHLIAMTHAQDCVDFIRNAE
ncbi:MAG: hypothetical protein MJH11_10605 [Lentisphaeria bacterium]|nr:hypothetical protein [Lentisphaeria bacterium]